MKIWLAAILFLASIFFDGIIFPALFGFKESFLTIIFLVVIVLYYEADTRSLVLGVVFSRIAEFYWGLKLGVLIIPLLASAATYFLLNKFLNIRSRILMIISGIIMFVVFWETSVLITRIL